MRARACVVSGFHTHLALPPHGGDEIVKGDLLEHWHELIVFVQAKVCLGGESLDLDPGHVVRRRGVLLKLVPSKVDLLALGRDPDVGLPPSTPPVLRHAAVTARGAVARLRRGERERERER